VIAGLAIVGLLACNRGGLPPEKVEAWIGRPAADLEREWGPPTKEVTDAGQRVLIYEEVERTGNAEFSREVSQRSAGSGPPPPARAALRSRSRRGVVPLRARRGRPRRPRAAPEARIGAPGRPPRPWRRGDPGLS